MLRGCETKFHPAEILLSANLIVNEIKELGRNPCVKSALCDISKETSKSKIEEKFEGFLKETLQNINHIYKKYHDKVDLSPLVSETMAVAKATENPKASDNCVFNCAV